MTQQDAGRHETPEERADRKWEDILQELRVMQTGAQLTAGFLLTLPFQSAFADLTDLQEVLYLGLVVLAAVITALVLTPVAIHRQLSGAHVKDRVVSSAHIIMRAALAALGLLVTGIVTFIFDVVVDRQTALLVGGCLAVLLVLLLGVVPRTLVDH